MLGFGGVLLSTEQYDAAESVFDYAQRGFSRFGRPVEVALARGGRGAAALGLGRTSESLAWLAASAEELRPFAPVSRIHKFHFDATVPVYARTDPERAAAYRKLLALF